MLIDCLPDFGRMTGCKQLDCQHQSHHLQVQLVSSFRRSCACAYGKSGHAWVHAYRGHMTTHASKKGSEKVLERVLGKASQKGS